MSIFREDNEGPIPSRSELIHLVNIWLYLEKTIVQEAGADPVDVRGAFERGRAVGVGMAAEDLLELLGNPFLDDNHDEDKWPIE